MWKLDVVELLVDSGADIHVCSTTEIETPSRLLVAEDRSGSLSPHEDGGQGAGGVA
jgi:hypothetical protein